MRYITIIISSSKAIIRRFAAPTGEFEYEVSCMNRNPWSEFEQATMKFNENLVDGLIRQPANAWTNCSYLIVGVVLLCIIRKRRERTILAALPVISLLVGFSSFLYHASNTFFFQVFDLASMYLFSSIVISLNLYRSGRLGAGRVLPVFAVIFLACVLVLLLIRGKIGAVLFGIGIAVAIAQELFLAVKNIGRISYRYYLCALAAFIAAFAFWLADYNNLPLFGRDDHIMQGHGLWHIINSMCFFFIYLFYRQFDWGRSAVGAGEHSRFS